MSRLTVYGGGGATAPAQVPFSPTLVGGWADTARITGGTNQSQNGLGINTLYLFRLWNPDAITIDQLSVNVTTAGVAAHLDVGVYSLTVDSVNGFRGTLLQDFGAADASTTGLKQFTGLALNLPANAWGAMLCDVAINVSTNLVPSIASLGTLNIQSGKSIITLAQAYGPLPATVSATVSNVVNLGNTQAQPTAFYHRSA